MTTTHLPRPRHRWSALLLVMALALAGGVLPAPAGAADATTLVKDKLDYEQRLSSVKALTQALQREARRSGNNYDATLRKAAAITKEAAGLAAVREFEVARIVLDDGYKLLQREIARAENARGLGGMTGMSADAGRPDAKLAEARQRELFGRQLNSTRVLLNSLKRLDAEQDGARRPEIAAIDALLAEAVLAFDSGNATRAGEVVDQAYGRTKSEIVRLQQRRDGLAAGAAEAPRKDSAPPEDAARAPFSRHRDSVVALLAAGERIATEKQTMPPEIAAAKSALADADALAAAGKFGEGRIILDRAYQLASGVIRSLRGGEQLRVEKRFATVAEEFAYERTRNDDYLSLIAGVTQNRADAASTKATALARRLRSEAEALHRAGKPEAALRKIEASTAALKGILRRAGFPIV